MITVKPRGIVIMKKFFCAVAMISALTLLVSCAMREQNTSAAVFFVNGEAVTEEEFDYFTKKYKTETINTFIEKYGAEYTEDFWQTEFEGKTPEEALDEKAKEECIKAKIQFSLMREEEIYTNTTYEALRKKAEDFNKDNENAKGTVGIKSINMSEFYTYYLENGIMELKSIYAEGKLKPDEKEIKEKANKMKLQAENSSSISYPESYWEDAAKNKLNEEKYEAYITQLCEKAEIKKVI